MSKFVCKHCTKTFSNQRSFTQHQRKSALCFQKLTAEIRGDDGYVTAVDFMTFARNKSATFGKIVDPLPVNEAIAQRIFESQLHLGGKFDDNYATAKEYLTGDDAFPMENDEESSIDSAEVEEQMAAAEAHPDPAVADNSQHLPPDATQPLATIMSNCDEFMMEAQKYLPLNKIQRTAIELLSVLRRTKASLDTHESVMEWHLRSTGTLRQHETLGGADDYVTRKKLFKFLKIRYNMPDALWCNVSKITLPSSNASVNIVWNDAQAVIQKLLTNPRITDKDYLFFNDDPFLAPPADLDCNC